eukprot:1191092-Prorocentrum_minimum.AAC.6
MNITDRPWHEKQMNITDRPAWHEKRINNTINDPYTSIPNKKVCIEVHQSQRALSTTVFVFLWTSLWSTDHQHLYAQRQVKDTSGSAARPYVENDTSVV